MDWYGSFYNNNIIIHVSKFHSMEYAIKNDTKGNNLKWKKKGKKHHHHHHYHRRSQQ